MSVKDLTTRQKSDYLPGKSEVKVQIFFIFAEGGLLVSREPIILLRGRFGHFADLNSWMSLVWIRSSRNSKLIRIGPLND